MIATATWEAVERIDGKWEVRGDHGDSSEGIPLFPGLKSDARLAAAAPVLLEAGHELLTYLESICYCGNNGGGDCEHCKAGENMRLAISKAGGQ